MEVRAEDAAAEQDKMRTQIKIKGMHCESCERRIVDGLGELNGVSNISVSLKNENATVDFNETKISKETIIKAINKMGYKARDSNEKGIFSRFFKNKGGNEK